MTDTRWAEKYLLVPYQQSGTGMDGADCWGLYSLILAGEAKVSYPDIEVSDRHHLRAIKHTISAQIAQGKWIKKWERDDGAPLDPMFPAKFDCLVMTAPTAVLSMRGSGLHVACALGDGRLIQTTQAHGPHIMAIDDRRVVGRILGVYRPADLG